MNFLQTLYIDKCKDPLKDSFGWARPEYHLMSWALSCLQLHKIYGSTVLHVNSAAAKLLIDTLQLPYNEVHITLDNLYIAENRLWALPKLHTYSLQENSFMHIDGDVYLFKEFDKNFIQNPLIAQNIELATEYYNTTQKQLMENFTYFPPCVRNDFYSGVPINAVNAGILGGADVVFFKQYTAEAFKYIRNNEQSLKYIDVDKFNVFFEQHLFYSMAKEQQKEVKFLFEDVFEDRGYLYLGNFHEVPYNRTYLHLLGHFKRNEFICRQLAAMLHDLYPEYYCRILSLFKNNKLPFYTNFFKEIEIKNISCCKSLIKSSYESFKDCSHESAPIESLSVESSFLNNMFELNSKYCEVEELSDFSNDFELFSKKTVSILNEHSFLSKSYLYGRDLLSINWCKEVFENIDQIENVVLQKTKGIHIIESSYNWAGLFNKQYSDGIPYYDEMQVLKGEYFNLIIPELTDIGFLFVDIEDIDKAILEFLVESRTIKEILNFMESYADDEVLTNHYPEFQNLIIESIRQLILNKAIKPV